MKLFLFASSAITFCRTFLTLIFGKKNNIKEIQLKQYKSLIDFAWNFIPAYRKLWELHGFTPAMFKSFNDLDCIPMIDKNFVRENLEALVATNYNRQRLSLVTTGGTTGLPMQFYIDQYKARAKEIAYQIWGGIHYWRHFYGIDKVIILRGRKISEQNIKKGIYWEKCKRENAIYMSSFHILEQNYEVYKQKLNTYRPKFIKAYPSAIIALCRLMKQHGDYSIPGLKGVICSSETIYDWHRQLVREVLGVEILSFYGHSEKCVCAFQNHDTRMEFQPFYGYVEFQPVGDKHEIVVTSLDNRYFPFIRYKTDDFVEGVSTSQLQVNQILGRRQEFLYDSYGVSIPFTCNDEIFWDVIGIEAYQYIQYQIGSFDILIQVSHLFNLADLSLIEKRAKTIFVNFKITIKIVDFIPKTKAGKFKYLIQNVKA